MKARVGYQFARLDGSHPSAVPVPNEHIIALDWFRAVVDVAVPIGDSWDVEVEAPYDIKRVRVRYELPDGTSFDNPQGDVHHRDETLEGAADPLVVVSWRRVGLLADGDFARVGLGFSIPVGNIEDDPYAAGAAGIKHQHIQFGTGTFDPILRLDYAWTSGSFGAGISFFMRQSVYENRHQYQGPGQFDLAVGPRATILPWLVASLNYSISYQTRAYWDDVKDPNTGYALQGISLSLPMRVSPQVTIVPSVMRVLRIDTRGDGDTFEMDWSATLGFEIALR